MVENASRWAPDQVRAGQVRRAPDGNEITVEKVSNGNVHGKHKPHVVAPDGELAKQRVADITSLVGASAGVESPRAEPPDE
jgi:hypothetical protein